MPIPIEVLEAEVMCLGAADRQRILERLLCSLDEASEIEASWVQEAASRKAALEAGEVQVLAGDEAIARIEALLV